MTRTLPSLPSRLHQALTLYKVDPASTLWMAEIGAGPLGGPGETWFVGFQNRLLVMGRDEFGDVVAVADISRKDVNTLRSGWTFLGDRLIEIERSKGERLLVKMPGVQANRWPELGEHLRQFSGKAFQEHMGAVRVDQGRLVSDADSTPGLVAQQAGANDVDKAEMRFPTMVVAQSINVRVDPAITIGGVESTKVHQDTVSVRVDPLPTCLALGVSMIEAASTTADCVSTDRGVSGERARRDSGVDNSARVSQSRADGAASHVDVSQQVDVRGVGRVGIETVTRCSVCHEANPVGAEACHFCNSAMPIWDTGAPPEPKLKGSDKRASQAKVSGDGGGGKKTEKQRHESLRAAAAARAAPDKPATSAKRAKPNDHRLVSSPGLSVDSALKGDFDDQSGCGCTCSGCFVWAVIFALACYILSFFGNPQ